MSTIHLAVAGSALAVLGALAGFWLGRRPPTPPAALAVLMRSATRDQLTGVPNRGQLTARLRTLDQQRQPVVLAIINLNRFAEVNRYGYRIGDQLMVLVAGRLRYTASVHDGEVYRLVGDEFAAVWPARPDIATTLATGMLDSLAEPVELLAGGHAVFVHVTATAGITTLTSTGAGDPTSRLLAQADTALQHGKRHARGMATLWEPQLPVLPRRRRDDRTGNPQAGDR